MEKIEFLSSTRFWAMVVGAVSIYLSAKGYIGEDEMQLIATIMGGFITVRTIDRATEQKIVAAGVTKGTIDVDTLSGIPPQA